LLIHPAGSQHSQEINESLMQIRDFVQHHSQKTHIIGISTGFGVIPIEGKRITFEWLNLNTSAADLKKYTLIIILKKDPNFLILRDMVNRVSKNFNLITSDQAIEVYENKANSP
jgi:hypothetical protein